VRPRHQPDLISFTADSAQTVLSVSYSIVKLFSTNRVTSTLPVTADTAYSPAYWAAGSDASSYILKAAVYNGTASVPFAVSFDGVAEGAKAQLTVISADSPFARNTPANPRVLSTTVTSLTAGAGGAFAFDLPGLSVAVLVADK
jgi:alpha-N-arabinofuranosidase